MKQRSLILTTVAILAVLVAVPFAYAQHMRGRAAMHQMGPRGAGELGPLMMLGHLEHAKEALGLSDQQVADIRAIFQDLHAQHAAQREQLHDGMQSIAQILLANPNDLGAAQAQLEKQEAAQHALKLQALQAAAKALNVLTPDQRAKLSAKLADHQHERFAK